MDPDNSQNNSPIKVVDFAPFLDGSDRQGVSNAILDSFKTTGFVYLMNHGLPQNMTDAMFFWVSLNDCNPALKLRSIYLFIFGFSLVEKTVCAANGDQAACSASRIRLPPPRFVIISLFYVLLRHFRLLGYSAPGREKVHHLKYDGDDVDIRKNNGTKLEVQKDIKESFEVGREDDPVMPNIWYPEGVLPGFRDVCMDFFWVRTSTKSDITIYDSFSY